MKKVGVNVYGIEPYITRLQIQSKFESFGTIMDIKIKKTENVVVYYQSYDQAKMAIEKLNIQESLLLKMGQAIDLM